MIKLLFVEDDDAFAYAIQDYSNAITRLAARPA